ncbi:MAG: MATE family efflux transporter, partial [Pseudomonadota bacterium]
MSDHPKPSDFQVTNRMVLAISLPMTLSFMTVPLLGLVDTAVIGQFGDAAMLGGLAVGVVIFDLLFTSFNFLRTGTTAFVAQAQGRRDEREQQAIFLRGVILAALIGTGLLLCSPWLNRLSLWAMNPPEQVYASALMYVSIRFVGAPFALVNYAILGFLLGQGRAVSTLALQTLINALNILLSVTLGLWMGFGIAGVAWATVIGEATIALAAFIWLLRRFPKSHAPPRSQIMDRSAIRRLMRVNTDILIRSFALVATFFFFTRFGAQFDERTLAANAVLMHFFLLATYFLDGLAAASEQLAGRAVGAKNRDAFWQTVVRTIGFGLCISFLVALVLVVFGDHLVSFMTTSTEVRATALIYIPWAAATALAGV